MSVSTYAVPAGWSLILRDMGISAERVRRRAGIPAAHLQAPGARISVAAYHSMWTALAAEADDPALPVRVAEALTVEAFDPAIFAAICSPDLNHAAQRIAAHKALCGPLRLRVEIDEHETRLGIHWPADAPPPAVMGHTDLLFWVALARLATRAPVRPVRLEAAAAPAPETAGPMAAYAGVSVTPGTRWQVVFSALDARRPFLTANEGMWDFFAPELQRRLGALTAASSTAERVRAVLLEQLPAGDVAMETIGRKLGASKRTLQRRLKAEGHTYLDLLAATRESLARHYLETSALPVAEISFLLGYADPNSFYRAFHGWTGLTPETLRRRAVS